MPPEPSQMSPAAPAKTNPTKAAQEKAASPGQGDLFGGPPADKKRGKAARSDEAPAPKFRRTAQVAFNRPIAPLTYGVPDSMAGDVVLGALVEGRLRRSKEVGCVVAVEEGAEAEERCRGIKRLQPILRRVTPEFALTPELIELGEWMADYYMTALGEALACISFIGFHDLAPERARPAWRLTPVGLTGMEAADIDDDATPVLPKLTRRQRQVLEWMRVRSLDAKTDVPPALAKAEIVETLGVTDGVLKRMEEAGVVEGCSIAPDEAHATDAPPAAGNAPEHADETLDASAPRDAPVAGFEATPDQETALKAILEAVEAERYETFLLQGVTGSGKTEVYLRALEAVVARGRSGIVLVPEISLTPMTVARFRERFGERVGVYHSRQTPRDKLRLYRRLVRGEIDVVVGARSALFSPFERLGLIIVDEEHESTYKQDSTPRYHARDAAIMRATHLRALRTDAPRAPAAQNSPNGGQDGGPKSDQEGETRGAVVVAGSATPSLESAYNAEIGKYRHLELRTRIGGYQLPEVELIDMGREVREHGQLEHISGTLRRAMRQSLDEGGHVLLLLNRRGYTSFFHCPSCREAVGCPHCDVTLTHHKKGALDNRDSLRCHLCGHRQPPPERCPKCGKELNRLGIGTERLEEELTRLFPDHNILRLDQDTTGGKGSWEEIWPKLESGDVDIIFGTQMIAKGLHLERITCVGVVLADMALNQPDVRAFERAFSLITQVAGRAGRGELGGKVYVQTYQPHHFALTLAARHDYDGLYREELPRRRTLGFPPFQRLISVTIGGLDASAARDHAERLRGAIALARREVGEEAFSILGPTPAPIARIKDHWRWRILLRGPRADLLRWALRAALANLSPALPPAHKRHRITIDPDPQDLM